MSYILDALSKADARRQNAAPDLYARAGLAGAERSRHGSKWHPAWLWLVAALLVVGSVTALWQMLRNTSPAPTAAPPAPAAVKPAPPATKTLPMPPAVPAPAAAAPPQASAATSLRASGSPNAHAPKLASSTTPVSPKPIAKPTTAPTATAPAKPQSAPLPAPVMVKPAAVQAPLYAALSRAVKEQMPALSVGGSVYSPQPAARMVVLNGQVLREGDKVSDGLTVESIGPKTSVLNWQGTRFQLPH